MKKWKALFLAAALFASLLIPMGTWAQPGEADTPTLEERVYCAIDEYRQKAKAPTLETLDDLQKAAEIRAFETRESFSHTRPDGSKNSTVYEGERELFAELLWKGPLSDKSAESAVRHFYNSDSNKKTLLGKKYTHVGIGVYEDEEEGKTYVAILFISLSEEEAP